MTLALIASMFAGLGGTASAAGAPQPWPPNNVIRDGGEYTIPSGFTGTLTIATSDPVTLIGTGITSTDRFSGVSITYESSLLNQINLTLNNVYLYDPVGNGSVIDFTGLGNTLTAVGTNLLESDTYANDSLLHVGPGVGLTINGNANSTLYLYKSTQASAVGGDVGEASGAITFAGGNVFVKGSRTGATIGGDSTVLGVTNGDITISGGQLSIAEIATGAGIGASNRGQCAGNVYITGGSTLINVDANGSAIGRGAGGSVVGNLFMLGGSLKVVIDANAAPFWGTPDADTVSNAAITANIYYGKSNTTSADVLAIDLSATSIDVTGSLTVVATPEGGSTVNLLSGQPGLNQNKFQKVSSSTPANWTLDSTVKTVYLYLPKGAASAGSLTISDGTTTVSYTYSSDASVLTPVSVSNAVATYTAPNATVFVAGNAVTSSIVPVGGDIDFIVVPDSGYIVTGATATSGTVNNNNNNAGVFVLSGVTGTGAVTVTTQQGTAYPVTFAPVTPGDDINATIDVAGVVIDTSSATALLNINAGNTLTFNVTPDFGYAVQGIKVVNATYTQSGNTFTLTPASGDIVVTPVIEPAVEYTVTFTGGNDQVRVNGVSTTSAQTTGGGNLSFTVVPDLGYSISGVPTTTSGTITGSAGNYTLTGAAANATVTVTTTAAAGYWTSVDTSGTTWGGNGSISDPYTIGDALGLAKLLQAVNTGAAKLYSGVYFQLTANIDLSANAWSPIGGGHDLTTVHNSIPEPVASSKSFTGTFDGNGFSITGMSISIPTANDGSAGYGLFGFVNGGVIENLAVGGSVTVGQPAAGETITINGVGGVVGYTTGSVYNAQSNVIISALSTSATDLSQIGGVVGIATNGGNARVYIEYCDNTANLYGSSRFGGVIGAGYSVQTGGVVIDQSYNTGTLTQLRNGKSYVGGVVGYLTGYVQNSYNTGNVLVNGTTYAGGIAGLLSGSGSAIAGLISCYNTGTVSGTGTSLQALWGYSDDNPDVLVTNSVYLNNMTQDPLGQTAKNYYSVDSATMASAAVIGGVYLNVNVFSVGSSSPTLNWQNPATGTFVGPIYLDTGAASGGTGKVGSLANTLTNAIALQSVNRGTIIALDTFADADLPAGGAIALSGDPAISRIVRGYGVSGALFSITSSSATLSGGAVEGQDALSANAAGPLFSVSGSGALTVNATASLLNNSAGGTGAGGVYINGGTFTLNGGTIAFNSGYSGGGVGVAGTTAGTANINSGTISDNVGTLLGGGIYLGMNASSILNIAGGLITRNYSPSGGGIDADQGTLNLTGGIISDNTASNGGGINIGAANVSLGGGTITANTAASGAGVYVQLASASTSLSGTTISDNVAQLNGGGVFVNAGPFAFTSGTITGNTAVQNGGGIDVLGTLMQTGGTIGKNSATNGGGVYVAGTFNLNGGTISGNTATLGAGVYDAGTFIVSPSTPANVNLVDVIYLSTTTTYIGVGAELDGIASPLTVQSVNPSEGLVIAQVTGDLEDFSPDDVAAFAYVATTPPWYFDRNSTDTQIILTATQPTLLG
jgi:hypothetical protein